MKTLSPPAAYIAKVSRSRFMQQGRNKYHESSRLARKASWGPAPRRLTAGVRARVLHNARQADSDPPGADQHLGEAAGPLLPYSSSSGSLFTDIIQKADREAKKVTKRPMPWAKLIKEFIMTMTQ